MSISVTYTNGVVAVRETKLLRDKILRLTELSAEDAFRSIAESGFGKGAEAVDVYDYEKLLESDERDLDAFIAEYAPSDAERAYFLAPRDFHNAKAFMKAAYLNESAEKMLAPDGQMSAAELGEIIKSGEFERLPSVLRGAVESCNELIGSGETLSGAQIGVIFDRALYKYLLSACSQNFFLKKAIKAKLDMNNILSAMRSDDFETAEKNFIDGGKLRKQTLETLFSENNKNALDGTAYADFYAQCLNAKRAGLPFTAAEKMLDGYETELLKKHRFELKRSQPFIYYILRRRAENADLRIIFVCLLAGMSGREVAKRLRSV